MPSGTRRGGDSGMSLVEILVAVVILGIGVVGILSALAFLITSTERHRELADNNTRAVQAMEVVADPLQTPFTACDIAAAAYESVIDAEVDPAVNVVSVKEWGAGVWQVCGTPTLPLQLITITAPSPDGTGTVTMDVVKRGNP